MSALVEKAIGLTPNGWNLVPLGICCEIVSGSLSYTEFLNMASSDAEDSVECMGVKVSDMNLSGNERRFVTANQTKRLSKALACRKLIPPNTVVFPKRGAAIATNKKRLTTTWTVLDPNLIGLCPKESLDVEFLFYWSQTLDLRRITDPGPTPQLNKKDLIPVLMPVPSDIEEQRRIAAVLGVVQRAMEHQERLIELTTELKKVILRQLFTQGRRGEPQKQTEIGAVPESWEVVSIGSLGKVVTGSTPKTKVPEYYAPREVDFIAPADLGQTRLVYDSEKKISRVGLETIRRLPKNAVMCVCIGSSIGKVGMTAKESSATNQQINSIVCGERHESAFVYYLLSYLCDYWRGFATFGPVPLLSKGSFEIIRIAVPPTKEEQIEISQSLCALDSKAELHMSKHAALTALFRTLLHQLMTAQIRVHNLDLPELETATQG